MPVAGTSIYAEEPFQIGATDYVISDLDEIEKCQGIDSLKTEFADAYLTADDQVTYVVDTNKINYLDKDGHWQSVDDEIIMQNGANPEYYFQNKANDFITSFGLSNDRKVLSKIVKNEYAIEFSMQASQSTLTDINYELNHFDVGYLKKLNNQSNTIIYKDVFENADLAYTVCGDTLKEDIIFYSCPNIDEVSYNVRVNGLYFEKETSDYIGYNEDTGEETLLKIEKGVFYDSQNNKEIFNISDFVIQDANGKCGDLQWNYTQVGDEYLIKLYLDLDFLNDETTVYPVIVDPTVQGSSVTFDTFASRTYPDNNYYLSDYLKTGKSSYYGIRRSIIKWTLPTFDVMYPIITSKIVTVQSTKR